MSVDVLLPHMAGIHAGDERALAALIANTQRNLMAEADRTCHQFAEEAVWHAYFQAWQGMFDISTGNRVYPWLKTVVRNFGRSSGSNKDPVRGFWKEVEDHHAVDDSSVCHEPMLTDALKVLPRDHRDIFEAFYWQGRSVGDIAYLLGMNIATVKSNLQRGRKLLRKHLEASRMVWFVEISKTHGTLAVQSAAAPNALPDARETEMGTLRWWGVAESQDEAIQAAQAHWGAA